MTDQEAIDGVGQVARDLPHPGVVRLARDASDLHAAAGQIDDRPSSDSTVSDAQRGVDLEIVIARLDDHCSGDGRYPDRGSSVTLDSVTDDAASGSYEISLPADGGISTFGGTFTAARCSGYPDRGCR